MPSFEYENFLVKNPFEKERKEKWLLLLV
jgi:hypothetical protein